MNRGLAGCGVRLTGLLLLAVITIGWLVAAAGPAAAHATLETTVPADREGLAEPPEEVRLEFNEAVSLPAGGLRVYDDAGERVDSGDAGTGSARNVVRASLPAGLSDGAYIVTWRVISADGHPVKGAFVFDVGEAGEVDTSLVAELFHGDADRPYAVAATVARWVMYAGVLLAAGGVAFLVWVSNNRDAGRAGTARIARIAAEVAAVAAVLGVPLQAAQASGAGLVAFVRADLLADTLGGSIGLQSLVQLVGLVGLMVASRRPQKAWFAPAGLGSAAVALGALLLAGHTRTVEPGWLMWLFDAVHVAAAAVWFGGLVCLAVSLRRRFRDDPVGAARLVARFSLIATVSLAAVIAGGVVMSVVVVRALRALISTSYGWTLLAKTAVAAAVIAVGAYNNRRLVPSIQHAASARAAKVAPVATGAALGPISGADSPPADSTPAAPRAWTALSRTVRWEVAGLLVVLVITSALVYLQPAGEAAGITGAYSTAMDLGQGYELHLTVDPNRAGFNEIHMYLLDEMGRQAAADTVELLLSMPGKDIGPIRRTPQPAGPGHWILPGRDLSIPGAWQIEAVVGVSRFEELRQAVAVTVNP